ncbi:histidine phosphatase family protein [Mycoplasmatota bacterium WC44]
MRIHLIRHGLTKSNEERRYTGFNDILLSDKGRELLHELKSKTVFPKPDYIICSPMKRCKETFQILFEGLNVDRFVDDLRETNFGDWEGKTYIDLKNDPDYQKWISNFEVNCPPNGESFITFKERVVLAFDNIVTESKGLHEDVLVVTHGGVIRVLMEHYADNGIKFYNWNIPNGLGYTLEFGDEITYSILGSHDE